MYKGLQAYIAELERCNELIRITEFVDPYLEIAEIVDRISKQKGGGKALLFENNGTAFPLLINMMGSDSKMCKVLNVSQFSIIEERINQLFHSLTKPKQNLWQKLQLLPTLGQAAKWFPKVSNKKGSCQEVVIRSPNLNDFPILKCWQYDGGNFITLPLVHTKDLETGVRNIGMYRMQVFDEQTTGMHWHRHKTGARHYEQYKVAKQTMPVAVVLGGDPIYTYCATAPLPDGIDEYLLAGFLRSKSTNLVRCLTQPLEVPADADIVLEGYIDTAEPLTVEGPFGDHTGFYSLPDLYPRLHITCITHRKNAVYPATLVGIPPQEDAYIGRATERIFINPIRLAMLPEIIDMHLPFEGVAHNIVIVKIKKSYPWQAKKVANTLWGAGQMMFNKILIVVNGEVNIHCYDALQKCLLENFNPNTDVYFGEGAADVLDHATDNCGYGSKICFDATQKMPEENPIISDKKELFTFSHFENQNATSRIHIIFDSEVILSDITTCIWLLGNNIDPRRDCCINDGILHIDARTPLGGKQTQRNYPNIVCANTETIASIDKKWESLGIGNFIPSPSLRYTYLQKSASAEAQ
ncbi:MAG: menaquinone biosynthesis decarboxylase [Bacteroidales bacterium]